MNLFSDESYYLSNECKKKLRAEKGRLVRLIGNIENHCLNMEALLNGAPVDSEFVIIILDVLIPWALELKDLYLRISEIESQLKSEQNA